jgi:hypothetical protein
MKDFHAQAEDACSERASTFTQKRYGRRCLLDFDASPTERWFRPSVENIAGPTTGQTTSTKIVCDEASSSIVLEALVEAAFFRVRMRANEQPAIAS